MTDIRQFREACATIERRPERRLDDQRPIWVFGAGGFGRGRIKFWLPATVYTVRTPLATECYSLLQSQHMNIRPLHDRVIVKRILKKYGYPPDKQERATQTVLEQAEVLSEGWAVSG